MKQNFTSAVKGIITILMVTFTTQASKAQFFSVATSSIKTSTSYTIMVDKKNEYKKIRFSSFDASSQAGKIVLSWLPEQVAANSYYEVEVSEDMSSFTTAAIILDGASFDGDGIVYKYKGNMPELKKQHTFYYRIKQVAPDSYVTYSNVIAVTL